MNLIIKQSIPEFVYFRSEIYTTEEFFRVVLEAYERAAGYEKNIPTIKDVESYMSEDSFNAYFGMGPKKEYRSRCEGSYQWNQLQNKLNQTFDELEIKQVIKEFEKLTHDLEWTFQNSYKEFEPYILQDVENALRLQRFCFLDTYFDSDDLMNYEEALDDCVEIIHAPMKGIW